MDSVKGWQESNLILSCRACQDFLDNVLSCIMKTLMRFKTATAMHEIWGFLFAETFRSLAWNSLKRLSFFRFRTFFMTKIALWPNCLNFFWSFKKIGKWPKKTAWHDLQPNSLRAAMQSTKLKCLSGRKPKLDNCCWIVKSKSTVARFE